MRTSDYNIAIIGGGASGMAAALSAREAAPELKICVLERQARVGRKLLATGNGRCNLTNMEGAALSRYHGGVYLAREALGRFGPQAVRAFFSSLGLETVEDEACRVYPLSDQAASVVDVLRLSIAERDIDLLDGFEAASIAPGFVVHARDGRTIGARRVIVCCGGPAGEKLGGTRSGHQLLGALGHTITPLFPALCQLKTQTEPIRGLKGIKYRGGIALVEGEEVVQSEQGEVLFADYGLTGIAAMALSRRAARDLASGKAMRARLTLCPLAPGELARRRQRLSGRALEDFLTGLLPKRLGQQMLKIAGALPLSRLAGSLSDAQLDKLSSLISGWTLPLTGTQPLAAAQVTSGGADCRHFDPDTLMSRLVPGLFAAGEVLDIDGDCGGFNLQWAWASGMLSGESAAKSLL